MKYTFISTTRCNWLESVISRTGLSSTKEGCTLLPDEGNEEGPHPPVDEEGDPRDGEVADVRD